MNEWIAADLPVVYAEYDKDYAFDELHAHGSFRDRYPDRVTVYMIGGDGVAPKERLNKPGLRQDDSSDESGSPVAKSEQDCLGNFISVEICGGPHAENTKELHHFKILKEESSSSGIRRIKAIID